MGIGCRNLCVMFVEMKENIWIWIFIFFIWWEVSGKVWIFFCFFMEVFWKFEKIGEGIYGVVYKVKDIEIG